MKDLYCSETICIKSFETFEFLFKRRKHSRHVQKLDHHVEDDKLKAQGR